jgi:hypothetical protein
MPNSAQDLMKIKTEAFMPPFLFTDKTNKI